MDSLNDFCIIRHLDAGAAHLRQTHFSVSLVVLPHRAHCTGGRARMVHHTVRHDGDLVAVRYSGDWYDDRRALPASTEAGGRL